MIDMTLPPHACLHDEPPQVELSSHSDFISVAFRSNVGAMLLTGQDQTCLIAAASVGLGESAKLLLTSSSEVKMTFDPTARD